MTLSAQGGIDKAKIGLRIIQMIKTETYSVVTHTWLSRKLEAKPFALSAFITFLLTLGSLIYWSDWNSSQTWMPANALSVFVFKNFWQAWTTMFAHGDFKHLLSNSLFFFVFGGLLAGHFGFWVFPLLAFFFGGLINFVSLALMPSTTHLIGASGMVFLMGGLWLALYVFLDLKHSLRGRLLRFFGVSLMLFFPGEAFDPSTSYKTHFFGFMLGLLLGTAIFFVRKEQFESALQYKEIEDKIEE
jgi:rhomboid protease GluP